MRTSTAALDHLVLATPDLAGTTAMLFERTGVVASPGGQHVGRGSRNVLCSLGDASYLGIVGPAPEQPTPEQPRPFGLDELHEAAMVGWAVAVPDVAAAIASAR